VQCGACAGAGGAARPSFLPHHGETAGNQLYAEKVSPGATGFWQVIQHFSVGAERAECSARRTAAECLGSIQYMRRCEKRGSFNRSGDRRMQQEVVELGVEASSAAIKKEDETGRQREMR